MNGTFITIEGPDGAGKTTAARHILEGLQAQGIPCLLTREPGGSKIAEEIRNILLDPENTAMDPVTEAILYAAARRQHLQEIVVPALESGMTVLCDRFVDSSLAYQGWARGLGIDTVWELNQPAIRDLLPDLTILIDIDEEEAEARIRKRGGIDRFDLEDREFRRRVREGFREAARRFPERIVTIDGSGTEEEVSARALQLIRERLHG